MKKQTTFVAILTLALLLGAGTLQAGISCPDACAAMAPLQSYGTEDPVCLAACAGASVPCAGAWGTYFQCLASNNTPEPCWAAFSNAKTCSACEVGEVDLEGLDDAIFVNNQHYVNNQLACSEKVDQGGTVNFPYCEFSFGIDKALERQGNGKSTKVMVCPGTYLESHDDPMGQAGPSMPSDQVVVESVVRGAAVITGSEDWTGAWLPVQQPINEIHHNEFLRSIDPADSSVWWRGNLDPLTAVTPPPPPIAAPGLVRGFTASTATGEHFFVQALPSLGARRVTFSIYLYPQGVDRFQLTLLRDPNGNPPVEYSQGAWYGFELPLTTPCGFEQQSKDGIGRVEPLGTTGWYRVSLTQTFDTDPEQEGWNPPLLTGARLALLSPQGQQVWTGDGQAGVFVFGPQLDHRPLGEFGTEARDYVWTDTAPDFNPVTTVKTLYVNNPAIKTWTHDWGLALHKNWGDLKPIVRRSEMVFIEDDKLRQELSFADLRPGSFLVDDGISYAANNYVEHQDMVAGSCGESQPCSIYIDPPPGTNMANAKIEVASSPRLLWMNPVHRWEFRGLVFQHATGAHDKDDGGDTIEARLNSAVSFNNAFELTLLENRFDWNSAFGLGVSGTVDRALAVSDDSNNRLIRNTVNHNGIGGLFLGGCQNCEVTEDEYSHNNWSGAQGGFQGHTTAGTKFAANINTIVRGLRASDNAGHGLWFDYENQQVQVIDSVFENNLGTGIYFEANDEWCSPVANTTNYVIDCAITDNAIGVRMIGSRGTRLSLNQLVGNGVGLSLIGDPYQAWDTTCYPSSPQNTPPKWLRDVYLDNNAFSASCPGDLWTYYSDQAPDLSRWKPVMLSLSSWSNTYSHVEGLGTPAIKMRGELFTLSDWQSCDPASPPVPAWCFKSQEQGSTEQ